MERTDGIAGYLAALGWDCSDVDKVNENMAGELAGSHDLSQAHLWDQIHADMRKGEYQAVIMGTPCETASKARTGPPGPRPLRSASHIYGLPKKELTPAEHEQVRMGTYLALKSAETATLAMQLGIPWMIENPDPSGNPVSLFHLPEWKSLASMPGVQHLDFHQCPLGAETSKPTRILFWNVDLSTLSGWCSHTPKHWEYTDHWGRRKTTFAAHPPLAGRRREDGTMATKAAAAYPTKMNHIIATCFSRSLPPISTPLPRPLPPVPTP